jgi:hypothetical protein
VSAGNSAGDSGFQSPWFFKNGPSSVTAAPVLVAPGNNTEAEGFGVNFYWQDTLSAALYNIQVATDASFSFSSIVKEGTVIGTEAYIDGFDNKGKVYYWRVAGMNSLGTGPYSTIYQFTNGTSQECTPAAGTGLGLIGHVWNNSTLFIDTCKDVNNNYLLKDISRRRNVNPFGHNGQMADNAEIRTELYEQDVLIDTDNVWDAVGQASAVDAHQHAAIVYDFLWSAFELNSFDDAGNTMLSLVELPAADFPRLCPNNAFWDGTKINVCSGSGQPADSGTLDVIGHEWGHAITEKASNRPLVYDSSIGGDTTSLLYQGQSGALDEAFSDWMGTAVEHYYRYSSWNWTIGEGIDIVRDVSNPPAHKSLCNDQEIPQPDSMDGYIRCSDDYGGVHFNNGIPNKMFYLLSQGGTHNNVTVQGIGIDEAIKIALQANRFKWTNNVTFYNALDGMKKAAEELYANSTFEANQVQNAWAAVKVTTLPKISVSAAPISGGNVGGSGSYPWGTAVTVTATAIDGYLFKNWTENGVEVSISASYVFTVNGSRNLSANFVVVPPNISVTPTSNDFGSILVGSVSTPKTFTITNQGSQPLNIGAVYRDGSNSAEFLKSADSCGNLSLAALQSCTIQIEFTPTTAGAKTATLEIPSNDSTTPTFQIQLTGTGVTVPVYSITASAGVGGSISPPGTVQITSGGSQSYTITANTGFHVTDLKIDGVSVGALSSYTFTTVTADRTIEAVFAIDMYAITTSVSTGGTITPSSALVSYGGSQTFNIVANPGYSIDNVLVDGAPWGAITSYTFPNVTSPHSISATFAANACMSLPVSLVGSSSYFHPTFQTLGDGYNAASDGDIIELRAVDFSENVNINRGISVTLSGGYSCDYTSKAGNSNIKGSLTITNGAVVVDSVTIY